MASRENPLLDRTYSMSIEVVRLHRLLVGKKEFIMSKQLLRCTTAPGAMAQEAQGAHSTRDFIAKLEIGMKELRESKYWTRVLVDTGYLSVEETSSLKSLQNECEALLTSIIKTSKQRL